MAFEIWAPLGDVVQTASAESLYDCRAIAATSREFKHLYEFAVNSIFIKIVCRRTFLLHVFLAENGEDLIAFLLAAYGFDEFLARFPAHQYGGNDTRKHHEVACCQYRYFSFGVILEQFFDVTIEICYH